MLHSMRISLFEYLKTFLICVCKFFHIFICLVGLFFFSGKLTVFYLIRQGLNKRFEVENDC